MCICMTESLPCSPEMVTMLLIDYTPIQNKKFKKKPYQINKKENKTAVVNLKLGQGSSERVCCCSLWPQVGCFD